MRTAGQQNQCFEQRCLKRRPAAQVAERAQRRNTTPAQAGNERNAEHQIADHDGSITTDTRDSLVQEPHWLADRQRTDCPPEQW